MTGESDKKKKLEDDEEEKADRKIISISWRREWKE